MPLINNCWAGINFDGTDDCVMIADSDSLDSTDDWTVSCWCYPHAWNNAYGPLCYKDGNWGIRRYNSTSNLQGMWWNGTVIRHGVITLPPVNTSTNVILTISNNDISNIYYNGIAQNPVIQTWLSEARNLTHSFVIGQEPIANEKYDGEITEVAVWNCTLGLADIALLSSSKIKGMPLQIQPANLKGYWPMNDVSSDMSADEDTVRDLSGNSNNGTGIDGANNTGLTWTGESILSYSNSVLNWE